MTRLEATRARTLRVWWAFFWRAFLVYPVALGLGVTALLTPPAVILGMDRESVSAAGAVLCLAGWLALSVEALHRALGGRYPGFSVALLQEEPDDA